MTTENQWRVAPITGTFGAEVSGVRLAELDDVTSVSALLREHLLLVFRGQHLTLAEHSRFAHALGTPTPAHPVVPGHPDYPEILELDGAKGGKNARWHTDVTFSETPPAASILVTDEVPSYGGDTLWGDARSAYRRLAPVLRDVVDQLEAVHRVTPLAYWGEPFDSALDRDDARYLLDLAAKVPPVVHPVVRLHPVTGEPALFVNPGFTSHLVGLSRIESDHLLRLLYEHQAQPELTLRHRWAMGDVVIWDNQATTHYAVDDYGSSDRRVRRITLRGARPVGPRGQVSRVANDPLVAVR